jgi:hypothetical protein
MVIGELKGRFAPAERGARALTVAVLGAAWLFVAALNWPGHLSYDSVLQLLDARTGFYHTWHPPFMAWLLSLSDGLTHGTGPYMMGQGLLLFGSLGAIVVASPKVGRFSPLLPVILLFSPLVMLWQAIVWKDVLFADLTVAGFAALYVGQSRRLGRGWSLAVTGKGLVLLAAASLVRQNGATVLLMGVAAIGYGAWLAGAMNGRSRRLRAAIVGLAALAFGLLVALAMNLAVLTRAIDRSGPEAQIHMLQTFDVVGAVAHDPSLKLDHLDPATAALIRATAKSEYTPARNDGLLGNDFNRATVEVADDIQNQWFDIILHHPRPWVEHRLAVIGWHLTSPLKVCPRDVTGIDGPLPQLKALGMHNEQTPRDIALEHYASLFHHTPVYSHWFYAVLALVLTVVMFRSREGGDAVLGFMLIGALGFVASFVLIGVACDYRYLYALDLCTVVATFRWALGPSGRPPISADG